MSMEVDIRKFSGFLKFKARFLSKLPKNYHTVDMQDVCWTWQGSLHKTTGYGEIGWGKYDKYFAHRISYIVFNNIIPQGILVRHTCDNRLCVNPKHLLLGSHHDNALDSAKRHRQGHQKLNEEAVKVIKWMLKYKYTKGLRNKLKTLYHVTRTTICDIEKGKSWAWVQV